MKFRVRGKSVDFKNREGSSPSIPKKRSFDSLTIYPYFVIFVLLSVQNSSRAKELSFSEESPFESLLLKIQETLGPG